MIGRRLADQDRQDLDLAKRPMDERQMHFETMFVHEGRRRDRDVELPRQHVACGPIDRQRTKRRRPSIGRRHCHAAHWLAVVRAKQNHAFDGALSLREQTVGGGRDITRIDVARMRRDHRLWNKRRGCGARKASVHSRGKFIGAGRVEFSSEVGGLHG